MFTRFNACQSVEIVVPEERVAIQHYLRQPRRLVNALVDQSRTEQLSDDCFRLKMRPLEFMMMSIQPTVDMRVWALSDGTINLESVACEIIGVGYINDRFALKLKGQLSPHQIRGVTHLQGKADLEVRVELPPPLWLTPKPILEATGNGLLKSVLLSVKQRLMYKLLLDYRRWAGNETNETELMLTDRPKILSIEG
ncbi:MAG: DUF1997 domain-containing protein [Tychonema bourrellyi B0820]|uniref:DUF1997 domain-containing protein n=1 Tax=Tychonema bourrellyi FEM_GT703 TaxID=2040638 RepID=A0A2G4EVC8_9CYAN|nr:DUF1997 domain-containing protein [Tychonema bourrellyi]MDQ2100961.1 DUF1997 domain-containing protein [Tychonema bourrellyi B0820]PHX53493.1 DUF1997 domain-containing protein [Tychonema bourrellyi FEM_GT703]